ncbi:hypothetical protein [Burkholderia gladioli]|uniref:hypothetical protein n=1 Tax=Burkholderia gladioli TaxID=28095 RepID=UPI001640810A|nr:hypothetical protein [Burkholderia gladioli]
MLVVPKNLLPADQRRWHGFLRDYFCDKDAIPTTEGNQVHLQLEWPGEIERHVDTELQTGLDWWGGGVTRSSMWSALRRDGRVLTALYDTWTLLSWSEWLAGTAATRVENVVLLHVDDHRDLGTPRLVTRGEAWVDAITGDSVNLRDPDSVRKAIQSGAIGMGSFMTPFIHTVPEARVRHLCQPPKVRQTTNSNLVRKNVPDTLLHTGAERPAIDYVPVSAGTCGDYLATSDAALWASGIEGRPALVHIDMDYFNNRYDGDSGWRERTDRLDPKMSDIIHKIDVLVDALARSRAEIEDVVIAFSPGFFPAEYWQEADNRLRAGLEKIL